METRDGWGGYDEVWLGEQLIDHERAQKLIKYAMGTAASLINIPESEVEREKFFGELEATDDGEVVNSKSITTS